MMNKPADLEGMVDMLYQESWAFDADKNQLPDLEDYRLTLPSLQTNFSADNIEKSRWLLDPRSFHHCVAPSIAGKQIDPATANVLLPPIAPDGRGHP